MNVTHALYAPSSGAVRDQAVHLLTTAAIKFVIVEWGRTGAAWLPDEICLVTSIGEFDTLDRVRSYVQRRTELVAAVSKYARPEFPADADWARNTALASEAALAEDWLRPEEDEAWKDL